MLSFARRAFTIEPSNRHPPISDLSSTGLRLVLDQRTADSSPKHHPAVGIVLHNPSTAFRSDPRCFLSSCDRCKRPLKSGEDVYMYMGDQGFCSVECRTRQIAMDERKEAEEALGRRMLAGASDSPKCPTGDGCQTCRLLLDLRRRRSKWG